MLIRFRVRPGSLSQCDDDVLIIVAALCLRSVNWLFVRDSLNIWILIATVSILRDTHFHRRAPQRLSHPINYYLQSITNRCEFSHWPVIFLPHPRIAQLFYVSIAQCIHQHITNWEQVPQVIDPVSFPQPDSSSGTIFSGREVNRVVLILIELHISTSITPYQMSTSSRNDFRESW